MNVHEFIVSKFNNFVAWIVRENILPVTSPLLHYLFTVRDSEPDNIYGDINNSPIYKFINTYIYYTDDDGNVNENAFYFYAISYGVNLNTLPQAHVLKLKRYLRCLVKPFLCNPADAICSSNRAEPENVSIA